MKKVLLLSLLLFTSTLGFTQNITSAHFTLSGRSGEIYSAEITVGEWLLQLSKNGDLLNFTYLPGGDITFYSSSDGFDREGKIKSVGGVKVDYYDQFGPEEKLGKLKSIGNLFIDYYDRFGDDDMQGKVKSIGNVQITYYTKFDDDAQFKKLKAIGNIKISYYDRFGDDALLGFVKSIGPIQMSYYGHLEISERRGLRSIEGNTRNLYATAWF